MGVGMGCQTQSSLEEAFHLPRVPYLPGPRLRMGSEKGILERQAEQPQPPPPTPPGAQGPTEQQAWVDPTYYGGAW